MRRPERDDGDLVDELSGDSLTRDSGPVRTPDRLADPDLLTEVARAALPAHGLPPDAPLTLVNLTENATFAVDDPGTGERSALRLHRPGYHGRAAIESELAWIEALRAEAVVATPAVLAAPGGDRVVTVPAPDGVPRHTVRFAWVPGVEPQGIRLTEDFAVLGAMAARLHQHARQWRPPAGFTRLRWDYTTSLGAGGHWGRWQDGLGVGAAEREVLGRAAGVVADRVTAFGAGPDRFGLVHADMRLANLLVDPDGTGPIQVIDFDDCGFSWFVYDLAASLSFMEHDPRVPELMAAWVRGYRTVARLSSAEVAELGTFLLLRRLLLVAWLGSHAEVPLARELGTSFTVTSCDLAEAYLSGHRPFSG